MEVFLRDIDMLAKDLQSIGVVIEFGKSSDPLIKYPRNVYLKKPNNTIIYYFSFEDKLKSNNQEDNNLPYSLESVSIREKYGIKSESIKSLVESGNFKSAIKNYLRDK